MKIIHHGSLPLCWQVRLQVRGKHEATVKGPYTLTKARRVAIMAEWRGERAILVEDVEATARHRALINARRTA